MRRLISGAAAAAVLLATPFALSAQDARQQIPAKPAPHIVRLEAEPQPLSAAADVLLSLTEAGPEVRFRESATHTDELGMTHVTLEQTYQGIPVSGFGYTAHANAEGEIQSLTGAFAKTAELETTPKLQPEEALLQALTSLNLREPMWESADAPDDYTKPDGELVIYANAKGEAAELAYRHDVYTAEPLYRAWVYTSALDGRVLFENLRIHHANTPTQAVSDYNGTVSITTDLSGGTYTLRQTSSGGGVETRSLRGGTSYGSSVSVTDNGTPFNSDGTAVQAHYGAEQTYDYFAIDHGRNSYNNAGGKLLSYVHYSSNYVNAFWDGSRMTYGDGDGTSYGPLTSLDIAGHEMTHGVTEYAAGLVYRNESGALNESFSDIFGEMVEYHATGSNDWQMGTDIGVGRSGAIRSMNNPNAFGDPDTYGGTNYYTGTGDNGGVHINSGVQNKWFYILTVGESATNDLGDSYSVSGLGRTKAAAIAYRNLEVYLSANSNYADARAGSILAARDLYGADSAEEIAVTNAWFAVGVGAAYSTGGSGGTPSECVAGALTLTLVTDNYPGETSWTLKDASGATVESGSGYPGTNTSYSLAWNLAAGDYTFTINDTYGDGICCQYGNGSYTIESADGTTVATGGTFTRSEATAICVSGESVDTQAPSVPAGLTGSAQTDESITLSWSAANDNVGVTGYNVFSGGQLIGSVAGTQATINGLVAGTSYNFGVNAFDAAGNESAQATTTSSTTGGSTGGGSDEVLLTSTFETSNDGWIDGGADCYRYTGNRSYEGSRSMRLRDNSGVSSSMTTSGYDLRGAAGVDIAFVFYAYSMEQGEDFFVQYDGGAGWQTVGRYISGQQFENNTYYSASVTVGAAEYDLSANGRFRIQCDASSNGDQVYIDEVSITLRASNGVLGCNPGNGSCPDETVLGCNPGENSNCAPQRILGCNPGNGNCGGAQNILGCNPGSGNCEGSQAVLGCNPREDGTCEPAIVGGGNPLAQFSSYLTIRELMRQTFESELEDAEEEPAQFAATLLPNPARDFASLDLSVEDIAVRVDIFSVTGQLVKRFDNLAAGADVDVSSLIPGLYHVVVATDEGETATLRMVKE